jgi:hypothetical protein
MSSPTLAEIQDQLTKAFKHAEDLRKFGCVNTPNFLTNEDTLVQALKTDFAAEIGAGLATLRSQINAAVTGQARVISPLLRQLGKYIAAPETDDISIARRVYDYMHTNSIYIKSRGISYGSPALTGGGVGNGACWRLTKDDRNYDIQNCYVDAKIARCTLDANSGGQKHEETFEFRGATAEKDDIYRSGSGKVAYLTGKSGRVTQDCVSNPSFSLFSGTATTPTALTDWVTTTIANCQIDQVNYYRDFYGDTTPASLLWNTSNNKIVQSFSVKNVKLDPGRPYYCQIAFNRSIGAADGTLTLRCGASNVAVTLAAQSGWTILKLPLGTMNWFRGMDSSTPTFEVEWSARTTGSLRIDDFIFAPMDFFDGTWYAVVGGSTPFLKEDNFTWTDTETGGVIQSWLWRLFGVYWPHATGGSITWADPT